MGREPPRSRNNTFVLLGHSHMVEVPVSNEKLLSFRGDHVESHRRQGDRESKVDKHRDKSGNEEGKIAHTEVHTYVLLTKKKYLAVILLV